jgi:hypothetical protein
LEGAFHELPHTLLPHSNFCISPPQLAILHQISQKKKEFKSSSIKWTILRKKHQNLEQWKRKEEQLKKKYIWA